MCQLSLRTLFLVVTILALGSGLLVYLYGLYMTRDYGTSIGLIIAGSVGVVVVPVGFGLAAEALVRRDPRLAARLFVLGSVTIGLLIAVLLAMFARTLLFEIAD